MIFRKNKVWLLLGTLAVIIIILTAWQAPYIKGFGGGQNAIAHISAKEFVPADSNEQLSDSEIRLIVVTDFHATMLRNDRTLHIYLPPSYYENTDNAIPFYMCMTARQSLSFRTGPKSR